MLVGERILKLTAGRADVLIPVRLNSPEMGENGGWFCRYSIGWPDQELQSEGWGHDSLQALFLTLQKIGMDIYASPYLASGRLVWMLEGQGYGFPVPRNARDLLVGDDARFDS